MDRMWVTKRTFLQVHDDEPLARRIDRLEEALDRRAGAIVALERPSSRTAWQVVKILYELPVQDA